ncbi:transcription factor E2-alpha-like [Sinocyclocheilus grahami]|uniref:transcription factor E2-alpha-like n=1 Tax=Sinocyclocheilus grahami TaxID=75366 RepID=UPI0007AC578F|nr:PREDICTED: transcription factor E2-alpha-like [Sinocyclocheilus grahami]
MATVGNDMELNDLLDFSVMFPHPMSNGKNRGPTLPNSQFGLDERSGSGSWASGEANGPAFGARVRKHTHTSRCLKRTQTLTKFINE